MEEAAKQQRMEEAAKQQRPHRTDIEKAYIHDQPRAQLIENLKKKYKGEVKGGRRRSKKSDTKKSKNKSKSRSRSRIISTKRKNKNRRQTRK